MNFKGIRIVPQQETQPDEQAQAPSSSFPHPSPILSRDIRDIQERILKKRAFKNTKNKRLSSEQKNEIFQAFRQGESLSSLAQRHHRSEESLRRIILLMRAQQIHLLELDYIDSPDFNDIQTRSQEQTIMGPAPGMKEFSVQFSAFGKSVQPTTPTESLNDIPAYLTHLNERPVLSPEQEIHLFRKFNYVKFKAAQLRLRLDVKHPQLTLVNEIERLCEMAVAVKNDIIASNLRLVVSVAKKHVSSSISFYELISDGNLSLMKAVEKFNYSKGNKFSTYASWALFRNYARTIPDEQKYHERFRAQDVDFMEMKPDDRTPMLLDERINHERLSQVKRFMGELDDRERAIIQRRYGLGVYPQRQTLRQVGKEMGVTKERVRQIETRALAKMRKIAHDEKMEIPEL